MRPPPFPQPPAEDLELRLYRNIRIAIVPILLEIAVILHGFQALGKVRAEGAAAPFRIFDADPTMPAGLAAALLFSGAGAAALLAFVVWKSLRQK